MADNGCWFFDTIKYKFNWCFISKNFAIAIAFPFPLAGVLKYAGITLSWWGLVCLVCFVVVFVFLPIWWASFINAHRYQKLMKAAVKSGEFLETKIAECLPCLSLSSGQNMLITTMIEGNGDTAYNQDKQERNLIETHVCYLIGCVALSLSILLLYLPRIICC